MKIGCKAQLTSWKMETNASSVASVPPLWPWVKCLRSMCNPNDTNTEINDVNLPVEIIVPWLWLADRKSAMNLEKRKN